MCRKDGTTMTKMLNDFISTYTSKGGIKIQGVDKGIRLMEPYGTWKHFFEVFENAGEMVPYGKKLREITSLYDEKWDYLERVVPYGKKLSDVPDGEKLVA